MTIHEPATLATDYVLAILGIVCGSLLNRDANPAQRWWSSALWLSGAAAFVGGTFHGFGPVLGEQASMALWRATLLLICLTSAAMERTLVEEVAAAPTRRFWARIVWAKFAAFSVAAMIHPEFVVAILAYGLAMVALAAAALSRAVPRRGAMLAAVGLSALAAVVQQLQWGLGAHFNHNDVYHVIQGAAIYLFYRAGRALGSPPGSSQAG